MRDCNVINPSPIEDEYRDTNMKCIYKDVIIVGNGPSGIALSYLLSGHCPFYNRKAHPDPMLSARLIECTQKSLLHQDLSFLSQGIEGRSKNPVSLLIDSMNHPGADMGLEWPSLLTWRKTNKCLDHVVLGKGLPGGTWQGIADNVLTISPGRWMSLPGSEFKEYKEGRAPAPAVAQYYTDYVEKNGLGPYMAPHTAVTHVQALPSSPRRRSRWRVCVVDDSGTTVSYECRHLVLATGASDRAGCLGVPGEYLPFVTHDLKVLEERLTEQRNTALPAKQRILLKAKSNSSLLGNDTLEHVLRSTGNIQRNGYTTWHRVEDVFEDLQTTWRGKSMPEEEDNEDENRTPWYTNDGRRRHLSLSELYERRTEEKVKKQPVLVVGAGLSAADAILVARREGFHVIHAFRTSPVPSPLPAVMYPEYHEVYQLMQGLSSSPDYTPLPGFQVTELHADQTVLLTDAEGQTQTFSISTAAVLIGSQPDLSFLPKGLRNLGLEPNKPVDCKVNPIYIEPYSYRCTRAPPGLYALGPLVGDNFVRFLQGGAVAIASQIYKETNLHHCP